MPHGQHVKGATPKENRMYEHVKESEEASGRSEAESKRIGAATVNKLRRKRGETKKKGKK